MPTSFLTLLSSPELAAMRDMVDQQMNGEDLLLNFAVAAACNATQPCIQVCPCHGCLCATGHVGLAKQLWVEAGSPAGWTDAGWCFDADHAADQRPATQPATSEHMARSGAWSRVYTILLTAEGLLAAAA